MCVRESAVYLGPGTFSPASLLAPKLPWGLATPSVFDGGGYRILLVAERLPRAHLHPHTRKDTAQPPSRLSGVALIDHANAAITRTRQRTVRWPRNTIARMQPKPRSFRGREFTPRAACAAGGASASDGAGRARTAIASFSPAHPLLLLLGTGVLDKHVLRSGTRTKLHEPRGREYAPRAACAAAGVCVQLEEGDGVQKRKCVRRRTYGRMHTPGSIRPPAPRRCG
ncbi:hypothetical protein B0H10DRAFT_2234622 [Mycena sp. CBHHK59/15]|nr:hypothetical protein B0H10DRAFT_2234622 [Mycena sp. CBHHK59/15]